MDDVTCYVFKSRGEPPAKRRRVSEQGLDASLKLRKDAYATLWRRQEQQIHDVVRETNARTLADILGFVESSHHDPRPGKLSTALITTGAGSITHDGLFELLDESISSRDGHIFIPVQATDAPNLKILLKNINQKGTRQQHHDDEDDDMGVALPAASKTKGPKLLNYDLDILRQHCELLGGQRVVLAVQDSEAFDAGVLTDLFTILHSWLDRLPVLLLIGIATSVDNFHERLPKAALRCLSGQSFNVTRSEDVIERVYECSAANEDVILRIGATLSDTILQRQRDHVQSVEAFNAALKYAYMCHFHGNPLSIFLIEDLAFQQLSHEHFEALRNLPSFRNHAERLLKAKQAPRVRELLQSDESLFREAIEAIKQSRTNVVWLLGAIRIIQHMRGVVSTKTATSFSYLYIKALSGELLDSPMLRELLLMLKKASSGMLEPILTNIIDTLFTMPPSDVAISPDDFQDLADDLTALTTSCDPSDLPVKSQMNHDFAGKVAPRGRQAQHNQAEKTYSELLTRLHDLLVEYFNIALVSVKSIFMNEVLFYDMRASHRDVFTPRPRFAIERALSAPHDYLGCACCSSKDVLSPTQPPTTILYQLYLEAGAQINTFDLFTAFSTILASDTNPESYDEEAIMTLFYRGLAELKHIDLIRGSRRKVDHLTKTSWKGL